MNIINIDQKNEQISQEYEETNVNQIQNIKDNPNNQTQQEKINPIIKEENLTKIETNIIPQLPKISNVVSTADLGTNLNLKTISLCLLNCSCIKSESNNIRAIKKELKYPKATVLIFKTGKINCFGAQNEESSRKAISIIAEKINFIGNNNVSLKNFRIVNIVATCKLNFGIKLSKLNNYLSPIKGKDIFGKYKSIYEPDIFPGLVYYMNNPEITLLIFSGGIINFVGAKTRIEINNALNKIFPLLLMHKQS